MFPIMFICSASTQNIMLDCSYAFTVFTCRGWIFVNKITTRYVSSESVQSEVYLK